jgi:hypothetical protein
LKPHLLAIVLIASLLRAQTPTATITGIVKDQSGALVSSARVTIRNTGTNITHDVLTNRDGDYTVSLLDIGSYEVHVESVGFKKQVRTGLTLQVGETVRVDFSLDVGQVSDTVQVTAEAPTTQTDTASVGTVVDNQHVVEIPVNGRQFYSLATLVPGVTPPVQNSTLSFRGGFNVAGASELANNFTLNGFNNNNQDVSGPNFRPSLDVIQEFKVLTGIYPAEFGYGSGGQVQVTSKAGTNEFHGSAYEYIRNAAVDARNYFLSPSLATPPFKRNQFGVTVGGPLVKNKTFFFAGYEGFRLRQDINSLATVPLTPFLSGNFSSLLPKTIIYQPSTKTPYPNNVIPASAIDPAGKALLSYYPSPTSPTAAGATPSNNYLFSEIRKETMDEGSLRIDHTFSEKDTLRLTANFFNDPAFEPSNTLCGARLLPGFGCNTNQKSQLYGITETHVFSPTLVNEARVGYTFLNQPRIMEDAGIPFAQTYNLPSFAGGKNNGGVPSATITSYATIGNATNLPQNRYDSTYILGDSVVWTHDKHTFKFGVDASQFRSSQYYVQYGVGSFTFTGNTATYPSSGYALADVLLGRPQQTQRVPTYPNNWYQGTTTVGLFAQEDYKVRSNFTLNYGLRWELYTPTWEKYNQEASFSPITRGMIVAGQNGIGSNLWAPRYRNFAPRLGFSWQPFGNGKTVIHAGAGIFYNAPTSGNGILAIFYNPPIRTPQTFTSTLASPLVGLANSFPAANAGSSSSPFGIAQNFAVATINEWSFNIQRELAPSWVLDVTYFGSKGSHLPINRNINQPRPSGQPGVTLARPYAGFSNISFAESVGNSVYNSLQMKLQKRYSAGLSLLSTFTWGRSIDNGNGIATSSLASHTTAQDSLNLAGERGRSDFDIKYRFVFSPVYELPFGKGKPFHSSGFWSSVIGGWQVSALFSAQTGSPLTPYYSADVSGTQNNQDRPNVVGNPNSGPKTIQQWFNVAAFAKPAAGTFGNAGRNIINGPGMVNLDASVVRTFKIKERIGIQFRAQAYNTLNHPNFNFPSATIDSSSVGTISSALDPRTLEGALRVTF